MPQHELAAALAHELATAEQCGDDAAARDALVGLAELHRRMGLRELAETEFALTWRRARRAGDRLNQGWAAWGLAALAEAELNPRKAARWLNRALDQMSEASDPQAIVWCLARIAEQHRIQGALSVAVEEHQQLLDAFERIRDARGVVWALQGLAQVDLIQGRGDAARVRFTRSLSITESIPDARGRGWALRGLGEVARAHGEFDLAVAMQDEALAAFRANDHPVGEAFAHKAKADALCAAADLVQARSHAGEALRIFDAVGYRRGEAYAQVSLAQILMCEEAIRSAHLLFSTALAVLGPAKVAYGRWLCLLGLAECAAQLAEPTRARRLTVQARRFARMLGIADRAVERQKHSGTILDGSSNNGLSLAPA